MPTRARRRVSPAKSLRDQRARTARNREFLDRVKSRPCLDCKWTFPPECMDFDHVRGKKLFNVNTQSVSKAREKVLAEIAKCDLVCANCHAIRTRKQMLKKGRRVRRSTDSRMLRSTSGRTYGR